MFALSNTGIEGKKETTFHVFKLANILAWHNSFSLCAIFSYQKEISDIFDSYGLLDSNPLVFNEQSMKGALISKENGANKQIFAVFNVNFLDKNVPLQVTAY